MPANKKFFPIRGSLPIPFLIHSMSAPTFSQRFARSFINVIFVARNEFAAYFVSSALFSSMTMIGLPVRTKGSYNSAKVSAVFLSLVPMTIRSGFKESCSAVPSLRNSGLDTTFMSCLLLFSNICRIFSTVPTGTVLLLTMIFDSFK